MLNIVGITATVVKLLDAVTLANVGRTEAESGTPI